MSERILADDRRARTKSRINTLQEWAVLKPDVLALLEAGKKKLVESEWTQGAFARTHPALHLGRPIGPRAPGATCWCALGALTAVCRTESTGDAREYGLAVLALDEIAPRGIVNFNDKPTTTKEKVIAKFDEAIAFVQEHMK